MFEVLMFIALFCIIGSLGDDLATLMLIIALVWGITSCDDESEPVPEPAPVLQEVKRELEVAVDPTVNVEDHKHLLENKQPEVKKKECDDYTKQLYGSCS